MHIFKTTEERADAGDAICRTVGERLSRFMAERSLSRASLAACLATSPARIARFESGKSEMTAVELVLAAKALGVTSAILTGEEDGK